MFFVDEPAATSGRLRSVIDAVAEHRGIICCADAVTCVQRINELPAMSIVCIATGRQFGRELSIYLRDPARPFFVRSLPLVVFTRDSGLEKKVLPFGSVVCTSLMLLAKRILSLPSLATIKGEGTAGHFNGELVNVPFWNGRDWNFSENRTRLQQGLHTSRMTWYPRVDRFDEHVADVAKYVQGLQPVHRCAPGTFLAILREGGLMSKTEQLSLGSQQKHIVRVVRHLRLQELLRSQPFAALRRQVVRCAELRCAAAVALETSQKVGSPSACPQGHPLKKKTAYHDICDVCNCIIKSGTPTMACQTCDFDICAECEAKASKAAAAWVQASAAADEADPQGLSDTDRQRLESVVLQVVADVQASAKEQFSGIGYYKDAIMGTDRHIFATLGLNRGLGYGSVVLVLSRDLLFHPSTWVSPLAATGFMKPHHWVFRHRPWSGAALCALANASPPDSGDGQYEAVKELPEDDPECVEACVQCSVNMSAVHGWPTIVAREMDAMCHYLAFDHRKAYEFDTGAHHHGLDWRKESVRRRARKRLLNAAKSAILAGAWQQVVEYYESKDSHATYECHLPSFVPLAAIERVVISKSLYDKHSDVQEQVNTFVFSDGRRLKDLIVTTETAKECMDWQREWFDRRRADGPAARAPICVSMSGRAARPAFLPVDFGAWFLQDPNAYKAWEERRAQSMTVSFVTRSGHDVRVFFSSSSASQSPTADLEAQEWQSSTYHICLGAAGNTSSFITKGILGTRHAVHLHRDIHARLVCCSEGKGGVVSIWERYWFQVTFSGTATVATVRCGRGPVGHDVIMELRDTSPINDLKYIGLSCWNETTYFGDLQAD